MLISRTRSVRGAATLAALVACACAPDGPPNAEPGPAQPVAESPSAVPSAAAPAATPEVDARGVTYSEDWFTHNIPNWERVLGPLKGQPGLSYLEVGVFEGRSAIWMLDNVLTDSTSRLTGIDLFPGDLDQRYRQNLERSGHAAKTVTIKGFSQTELRTLPFESYDIIYIDGSHTADDVLSDMVQSWELLKVGGLMILDDYAMDQHLPFELRPLLAVNVFTMVYRHEVEIVDRDYQLFLRKVPHPCAAKKYCSPIGPYLYLWETWDLVERDGGARVPLSEPEARIMQDIIRSERFQGLRWVIAPSLRDRAPARDLIERLGLEGHYAIAAAKP